MRINIQRLTLIFLVSLVLPLVIALLADYSLGWLPLLTIGASAIFIPLSTVVLIRATLDELDKVIRTVAPLEVELKNQE